MTQNIVSSFEKQFAKSDLWMVDAIEGYKLQANLN